MEKKGYIYIRTNSWWIHDYNAHKLGKTLDLIGRNTTYLTSEPKPGKFLDVYELDAEYIDQVDITLTGHFKKLNIYFDGGGTEFYKSEIRDKLEPYLQFLCRKHNISYKKLTDNEIEKMKRQKRSHVGKKEKIKSLEDPDFSLERKQKEKEEATQPIPYPHQEAAIMLMLTYFITNSIGKIVWPCGIGKALLSIFYIERAKFKNILIGVPSIYLQKQMSREILKIFPNADILFVGGDPINKIKSTTEQKEIETFANKETTKIKFIITTYSSCHLLNSDNITFDFKVGDECHHLVGIENDNKGYRKFHQIIAEKTLFMTATEKIEENKNNNSMDDETIFGKSIDSKTVHFAIEEGLITDYNVLVIKNTEDDVDQILKKLKIAAINKELFISTYMTLKSFIKYDNLTHILLYTNSIADAEQANKYISDILSLDSFPIKKTDIFHKALHSGSKNYNIDLEAFGNAKYGIIPCVHLFGEGFDFPKLNGVCIAGNMNSEIRIVQYLLRPNRLDSQNPDKIAYLIIPYIDTDNWDDNNSSYEKVRNIISQMRHADKNIEQKIKIQVVQKKKEEKQEQKRDENGVAEFNYINDDNELQRLKIRLRRSRALTSKKSPLQLEYEEKRLINIQLNLKSPNDYKRTKNSIDESRKVFWYWNLEKLASFLRYRYTQISKNERRIDSFLHRKK